MTTKAPKLDVVGTRVIAERCGVNPKTPTHWMNRHPDFPKPRTESEIGRLWDWADIEAWLKATGREHLIKQ